MIIKRDAYDLIKGKLRKGKVVVLYGPRRAGKTFLLETLKKEMKGQEKILFLNGESRVTQENLTIKSPEQIKQYIGDATLLIVDEAQKVPEIGLNLKIIVDTIPELKVVASGSASFELAQKVGEPLTGRKKTIILYPVAAKEIIKTKNTDYYHSIFEHSLVVGGYPELFSLSGENEQYEYLNELVDSYLLKDILEIERVKSSKKLRDLLILLAFQIGKEVSLSELGNNLDLHKDTVSRYLDLLEKSFVILNIRGFSRNLRKEVTKNSRYYFYDNGIRNALINNFNPLNLRNDIGMLWENYIVMERIKKQKYDGILSNNYFWRTYDRKEIDFVEERGGRLYGYEIKWGKKKRAAPKDWLNTYSNAEYTVIDKTDFIKFIT